MKLFYLTTLSLATLLFSCSNDDDASMVEEPEVPVTPVDENTEEEAYLFVLKVTDEAGVDSTNGNAFGNSSIEATWRLSATDIGARIEIPFSAESNKGLKSLLISEEIPLEWLEKKDGTAFFDSRVIELSDSIYVDTIYFRIPCSKQLSGSITIVDSTDVAKKIKLFPTLEVNNELKVNSKIFLRVPKENFNPDFGMTLLTEVLADSITQSKAHVNEDSTVSIKIVNQEESDCFYTASSKSVIKNLFDEGTDISLDANNDFIVDAFKLYVVKNADTYYFIDFKDFSSTRVENAVAYKYEDE